jgi:acetyltransferase-like isoleucine patch superfamily enzyme
MGIRLRWVVWRLYTRLYACRHKITVGRRAVIRPGAVVRREGGGDIVIGAHCHIHPGAMILAYGGRVEIGDNCTVNPYSILYGHGGLTIGRHVRIAAHCTLIPANHGIALGAGLIAEQPETRTPIRIGDDVWLGTGVRVLAGAVIESGAVVAAGAVARGVLQANGVYGGVPAKLIRMRSPLAS